jgi:hypothetical protein
MDLSRQLASVLRLDDTNTQSTAAAAPQSISANSRSGEQSADGIIAAYLRERVDEFRRVELLREAVSTEHCKGA